MGGLLGFTPFATKRGGYQTYPQSAAGSGPPYAPQCVLQPQEGTSYRAETPMGAHSPSCTVFTIPQPISAQTSSPSHTGVPGAAHKTGNLGIDHC